MILLSPRISLLKPLTTEGFEPLSFPSLSVSLQELVLSGRNVFHLSWLAKHVRYSSWKKEAWPCVWPVRCRLWLVHGAEFGTVSCETLILLVLLKEQQSRRWMPCGQSSWREMRNSFPADVFSTCIKLQQWSHYFPQRFSPNEAPVCTRDANSPDATLDTGQRVNGAGMAAFPQRPAPSTAAHWDTFAQPGPEPRCPHALLCFLSHSSAITAAPFRRKS